MRIGLKIDHNGLSYGDLINLVRLGEDLGYDTISISDRLGSPKHRDQRFLEVWSVLPGLALNTRKVKLAALVSNNLLRHPGLLAKIASSVDQISKGRLVFGIGAGSHKKEMQSLGFEFPDYSARVRMLDESLQVITKLWTDEANSTFDGEFYKLDSAEGLPKPYQKPHPPILVGGIGEKLLEVTAKYADISNFNDIGPEESRKLVDSLARYCDSIGRNYSGIRKSVTVGCIVTETEPQGDSKKESSSWLFGSPHQLISQLKEYEDAGITEAIIHFPRNLQSEMAKTFAEEVLPKVPVS